MDLCPPKPYATDCMKYSYVHGPATGVPLTTQHRVRHLVCCHGTWTIELRRVLLTDKSRFCLWRNDGPRCVWPDEPSHFAEHQTSPTKGIMVSDGIKFDDRVPLVHIDDRLTVDFYVTQVVEPIVFFFQGIPNMVF
ncbi:hypothetical protein TNCV_1459171 [Trichonephila clavipes]|nr:hypothetical protein TNCV_1459171 [Trichonephila clavipes]